MNRMNLTDMIMESYRTGVEIRLIPDRDNRVMTASFRLPGMQTGMDQCVSEKWMNSFTESTREAVGYCLIEHPLKNIAVSGIHKEEIKDA